MAEVIVDSPTRVSQAAPIKSLNPYRGRGWKIRARITQKGELKDFTSSRNKTGKLFSITLVDEEGDEIRATLFNEAAEQWYPILTENGVYEISKGLVKQANRKFSTLRNFYEISLDKDSIITPVKVDDVKEIKIPKLAYKFVPIASLTQFSKDDIVDVVGKVHKVGTLTQVKNGTITKRSVTIYDKTASSIEVTLWGALATNLPWKETEFPVLALKGVKVSDFSGHSLTTLGTTHVNVNPDIPETEEINSWAEKNKENMTLYSLSQFRSSGMTTSTAANENGSAPGSPVVVIKDAERKTLTEIQNSKIGSRKDRADYVAFRGYVEMIKNNPTNPSYYLACPTCSKKLNGSNCSKCQKTIPNPSEKYMLSFAAMDSSGSMWLSCFNEPGEKIMGISAHVFAGMSESEREKLIRSRYFKSFIFTVRAKTEEYNGKNRIHTSVIRVEPIDFLQESRSLLEKIKLFKL